MTVTGQDKNVVLQVDAGDTCGLDFRLSWQEKFDHFDAKPPFILVVRKFSESPIDAYWRLAGPCVKDGRTLESRLYALSAGDYIISLTDEKNRTLFTLVVGFKKEDFERGSVELSLARK